MENLKLCLSAIVPILLLAALGYTAKRTGLIREEDVPRANKWSFAIFMSLMCFYNIYTSDLSSALRPKLILFTLLAILAEYALSFLCTRGVKEPARRGVMIQGLFRSNYAILGLPMAAGLAAGGDIGVAAVMGAVVVPCFNVLAVITLNLFHGSRVELRKLLLGIARNPLILGTAVGLLFLLLKIRLPEVLEKPVRDLAKAASPLMLFLMGAFFRFRSDRATRKAASLVCVGRLLVIPALVLSLAVLLGFRGVELITLLAVFATPAAVASFTMAEQLGGDAELAGNIVVLTSFFSAFSLFAWSFLFKMLNFY